MRVVGLLLLFLACANVAHTWPSMQFIEGYLPSPMARYYHTVATATSCYTCRSLVELLGRMLSSGDTALEIVRDGWHDLCLKSAPEFAVCRDDASCSMLCEGLFSTYEPVFAEAIALNPQHVHDISTLACAKYANCADPSSSATADESVRRTAKKIDETLDMAFLIDQEDQKSEDSKKGESFFFLQITDVHMDLSYAVGSEADCPLPLCCHAKPNFTLAISPSNASSETASSGIPESVRDVAGPMGHLSCDPPPWFVQDAFRAVPRDNLKFVIWTGDNPSHDQCWEANKRDSLESSAKLTQLIREAFPNVPVFPTIGNHEIVPIDMFHADATKDAWLYNTLADLWAPWLPPSAVATLRAYGYYTALIEPGLRIISLNTNFWIAVDWLKIARHEDINHQIKWLSATLELAERNAEKVYLIGHMPIGDSDQDDDLTLVIRMVTHRYRNTLLGMFFGHKHQDIFKIMTNPEDNKQPIGMAFVAPALTPFKNRNPSFRLYEADRTSKVLLDYHQYRLESGALLNAKSVHDQLRWTLAYSAKSSYGLPSLNPSSWMALIGRARHTPNVLSLLSRNAVTGSDLVKELSLSELSCYALSPWGSVYEACLDEDGAAPESSTPSMWSF